MLRKILPPPKGLYIKKTEDFKMAKKPSTFHALLIAFTLIGIGCDQETPPVLGGDCSIPEIQDRSPANSETENSETTVSNECELPEPSLNANLKINAHLRDFNFDQTAKMQKALDRLKIVINSEEFKQEILGFTYQGKQEFVDNRGMSNLQVYETILRGVESLNGIADEEMDIDITLYYSNNSTVGYTYPNVDRIWVNNKFFANFTLGKVAANVAHEWTHKIGFGHDFNRTASRPYSVPYGVGSIIQRLVDKM